MICVQIGRLTTWMVLCAWWRIYAPSCTVASARKLFLTLYFTSTGPHLARFLSFPCPVDFKADSEFTLPAVQLDWRGSYVEALRVILRSASNYPYLLPDKMSHGGSNFLMYTVYPTLSWYTQLASFCIWVLWRYLYLITLIYWDPPQRSVPMAGCAVTERVVNSPSSVPIPENDEPWSPNVMVAAEQWCISQQPLFTSCCVPNSEVFAAINAISMARWPGVSRPSSTIRIMP